jgi:hypothetical protein
MEAKAGIAAWRTFLRRKELPRGRRSKEQKKKNRDPNKDDRTSIADCKRSLTFLHPKKQKLLQLILPSMQEVLKKKATSMHNLQQQSNRIETQSIARGNNSKREGYDLKAEAGGRIFSIGSRYEVEK